MCRTSVVVSIIYILWVWSVLNADGFSNVLYCIIAHHSSENHSSYCENTRNANKSNCFPLVFFQNARNYSKRPVSCVVGLFLIQVAAARGQLHWSRWMQNAEASRDNDAPKRGGERSFRSHRGGQNLRAMAVVSNENDGLGLCDWPEPGRRSFLGGKSFLFSLGQTRIIPVGFIRFHGINSDRNR
jgi:hypothetical protein